MKVFLNLKKAKSIDAFINVLMLNLLMHYHVLWVQVKAGIKEAPMKSQCQVQCASEAGLQLLMEEGNEMVKILPGFYDIGGHCTISDLECCSCCAFTYSGCACKHIWAIRHSYQPFAHLDPSIFTQETFTFELSHHLQHT